MPTSSPRPHGYPCPVCGGRLVSTSLVGTYQPDLGRVLYWETDPIGASWRCDRCRALLVQAHTRQRRQSVRLLRLLPNGQIRLAFQGASYAAVGRWRARMKPRHRAHNGRLWIEAVDEPARLMRRGGRPRTRAV